MEKVLKGRRLVMGRFVKELRCTTEVDVLAVLKIHRWDGKSLMATMVSTLEEGTGRPGPLGGTLLVGERSVVPCQESLEGQQYGTQSGLWARRAFHYCQKLISLVCLVHADGLEVDQHRKQHQEPD